MGLFDILFNSRKEKSNTTFSSNEMILIANDWTSDFLQYAPKLLAASYDRDEIYMFCSWILLDYGRNYGYLNKDADRNKFFDTIFQAVRNTGEYNQTDMEQFMFRVSQYKSQIMNMLKSDYPRTKMFFPETLYSRFVHIDYDHYHPDPIGFDDNLIIFTEYIGEFWNKVNRELMRKYPSKIVKL